MIKKNRVSTNLKSKPKYKLKNKSKLRTGDTSKKLVESLKKSRDRKKPSITLEERRRRQLIYQKKRYLKKREELISYQKEYNLENKEKISDYKKSYYLKNKEKYINRAIERHKQLSLEKKKKDKKTI